MFAERGCTLLVVETSLRDYSMYAELGSRRCLSQHKQPNIRPSRLGGLPTVVTRVLGVTRSTIARATLRRRFRGFTQSF
jgi:hypothetical protein